MSQVDRDINRLMTGLRRAGELSQTIVIYVSDNGFFFGEHRLPNGKGFPYEEALRVPFVVRVPQAFRPAPSVIRDVVSNQDIAPTILDYANADSCAAPDDCRQMDGHSLVPLLGGRGEWPKDRGVLAELNTTARTECGCAYQAIRTRQYLYNTLSTGEKELYNLRTDPYELRNLAGTPGVRSTERGLAARLTRLRDCSGPTCE